MPGVRRVLQQPAGRCQAEGFDHGTRIGATGGSDVIPAQVDVYIGIDSLLGLDGQRGPDHTGVAHYKGSALMSLNDGAATSRLLASAAVTATQDKAQPESGVLSINYQVTKFFAPGTADVYKLDVPFSKGAKTLVGTLTLNGKANTGAYECTSPYAK